MPATSREPPAPSVLRNRPGRLLRLMTEGVGETSGETVGSPSVQGCPCQERSGRKAKALFVRCGVQPAISPGGLSGWNLGSDVFTDALVPSMVEATIRRRAGRRRAPYPPDRLPAFSFRTICTVRPSVGGNALWLLPDAAWKALMRSLSLPQAPG